MGLEKAIEHGKEKRKPYRCAKAVDTRCRNHAGKTHSNRKPRECEWCLNNRLYQYKKELERCEYEEN